MEILSWQKEENIAVITMSNGENRHNMDYADRMLQVLNEILKDISITALVLTSNDAKNFSQGVDVEWLMGRMNVKDTASIKGWMYKMNEVFKSLLLYPVPTIAAINGHAFGNGAIISCACDFRFMRSDRGFFCFPEVNIGIPFLPGMIAFVKKAVPYYKFNEMLLTGNRYTATELEKHNIILKACPDQDSLMNESIAFAKTLNKKRGIFGEIKKRLHKEIVGVIDREDSEFIEPLFLMVQD